MREFEFMARDITDWLIFAEKDLVRYELADEGTELRAEWCPKGDGIAMYIGFESPEGNMAYRELGEYPTEREIAEAVAEVLAEGRDNYKKVKAN